LELQLTFGVTVLTVFRKLIRKMLSKEECKFEDFPLNMKSEFNHKG
jgi:hypothetical protein